MLVVAALVSGPVLVAPSALAAPEDQPVAVESATLGEAATHGGTPEAMPSVPAEPEAVPESADEPLSTPAENPAASQAEAVPLEAADGIVEAPSATLTVSSDAGPDWVVGQKVTYTTTVTNTGNVALSGVALSETHGVGATCDTTTVDVGAAAICISTYVVTQYDFDYGVVWNNVSGAAVSPAGSIVELPLEGAASTRQFHAAATLSFVSDAPGNADVVYGQKLTYTVTMTNTGDVTLSLLQHFSQSLSADTTCQGQVLTVGGTLTCTAVHWITDVDVAAGSITNTITIPLVGPADSGVSLGPATLKNKVIAAPVVEEVPVVAAVVQGNMMTGEALANTGSVGIVPMILGAGALLLAGAGTLTVRRREKHTKA